MRTLTQKVVTCLAGAALVLGGLAGCGGAPEPKTTAEVVQRFNENKNHDNYHMDMTYDITMGILGQEVAVKVNYAMDAAGNDAHGTLSSSVLGQDIKSEMYLTKDGDKWAQYTSNGEGAEQTWSKATTDDSGISTSTIASEDALKDGTFEKTDNGYKVTVAGDTFLDSAGLKSVLGSTAESDAFKTALKDASAVYTFDKDCMLTDIQFTANANVEAAEGTGVMIDMKLSLNAKLSGYGSIDANSVKVPDTVKQNATDYGQLSNQLSQLLTGASAGDATAATTGEATTPATTEATTPATTEATTEAAAA